MTLKASRNAISSQGSASGLTPCAVQDGPMIAPSGQAHAPASLSVSADQKKEKAISATSSRHGFVLYRSASLTLSLANRLRAKTALIGSTMYKLSWKTRLTPLQVSISALRASVLRTSASASSGWPTPTATDGKGGYLGGRIRNGKLSTDRLDVTAQLTGWPTPTTIDNNQVAGMGAAASHPSRGTTLGGAARLTSPMRLAASGQVLTGFSAEMESGGQLNPDLSRWLMGLPDEWASCAPTATPSLRRSRKHS